MSTAQNRPRASLIRGLQYFETVARHRSVKLAAEELKVSQSAVSHQLRELTEALGEQLLVRAGRGIAVSPAGQRLAERLATTFASLQSSVEDVVGGSRQILRLAVCSSFGPGWLIERLGDFLATYPHIDLQLRLYAQDPEQTDQVADAFVTALPVQPGYASLHIIDETLVAVRAPSRPGRRQRLITTDIEPLQLGRDWQNYCRHTDLDLADIQEGTWLQCSHYLLALEMARAGLGAALVPDFVARRDIEQGSLVYYERARLPWGRSYHLCYKQSRGQESGLVALTHWLKGQLAVKPVARIGGRQQG